MTTDTGTPCLIVVRTEGIQGPPGAAGAPGDTIIDKPVITPILGADLVPIIRDGSIYLATVADVQNTQPPSGEGGQFDFSDPDNSAYAAII